MQFLKVKYSLSELERDFKELKDRDLKDIQVKLKREIDEVFLKPTVMSIDDIDNFEQKNMEKKKPIKNFWYDWSINFIRETTTGLPGLVLKNTGEKIGTI